MCQNQAATTLNVFKNSRDAKGPICLYMHVKKLNLNYTKTKVMTKSCFPLSFFIAVLVWSDFRFCSIRLIAD